MMKNMRRGIPNLFKDGTRIRSGADEVLLRNVEACVEAQKIFVTSMGPTGHNKMVVNHLEKLFVTSDTVTLLKEMELNHPAAKMIEMACVMQETEIGDGSNFVISFAGEILKLAGELVEMGLHTADIITGYTKAVNKALEIMEELVIDKIEAKDLTLREKLITACVCPISSKQYGYENFLAPLVADACMAIMPSNSYNFHVDNVRVVKLLGGSLEQSEVIKGSVLVTDTLTSIKSIENVKIAVYTCSLGSADTETKGTVLIHNASELMNYNKSEENEIEKLVRSVADAGVRLVVTGSTVDDMALHFFEKYQIMVIKITSKFELRRICRTTKSRPLVAFGPPRDEDIGYAHKVYVKEIGLTKVTIVQQGDLDNSSVATILLRSSTHTHLNDVERAIDDGVNTIRALTRDGRLVAAGGGFEIELSKRLQKYAQTQQGIEQYAFQKFAEALEVIPRSLAENAGLNAMDIISDLYAKHEKATDDHMKIGIDLDKGTVGDLTKKKLFDLFILKKQAIRLAVDAALTVLRVDQIIQAKPAGGPKLPKQGGNWDDDD